jgi:geranylgeranyl diphosphate synthase type II
MREFGTVVESALAEYVQFEEGCPEHLREAIHYSLLAPGKRLRPMLVLMAAEACGGQIERALPAACAVEMIHAYSLIHDDLPAMDDDDMRRGRPSCHRAFDEATAILAGDALQARAFEVLARHMQPASVAVACCRELATAAGACQLVGGQADDLHCDPVTADASLLHAIHRRKTGAMFTVSLRLGGLSAEADNDALSALVSYGNHLGLAFQIVDDLLDATGEADVVGKRTGKDAERGKLTFPGVYGVAESRRRATELIRAAMDAAQTFDTRGEELVALAQFVLDRNQ